MGAVEGDWLDGGVWVPMMVGDRLEVGFLSL